MAASVSRQQRRAVVGAVAVLLVALVVGVVVTSGSDDSPADVVDVAATGEVDAGAGAGGGAEAAESDLPAGEFELFDGGTATFADFRGTPLVVNFWASWCPACVAELPEFQQVHEERADAVQFLGIANADLRGPALRLAGDVGLTYTLADDPNGDLFRELGLIAMPSTVFVDADGRIVDVFAGQLDEEALNERVDRLLGAS